MSNVKKIFAVLFAVMAVMLMSTAVFAETKEYYLWVKGVQVTSSNANDILGDGVFSYNADTKTLTISGDCTYTGNYHKLISNSGIKGLTINVAKDSTLKLSSNSDMISSVIGTDNDMTITGSGKLTLISENSTSESSCGISVSYKSTLTLENASIEIIEKSIYSSYGIRGSGTEKCIIKNSDINIDTDDTKGIAINDFIELELYDCKAVSPEYAVLKGASYYDTAGKTKLSDVKIGCSQGSNEVSENIEYDILIDNIIVTSENAEDILGDGNFEYDPASNILYLYGGTDALISSNREDLTIKVEYDCSIKSLYIYGNATITGRGKLTTYISTFNSNKITFDNADVVINGKNYAINNFSNASVEIINSDITMSGGTAAMKLNDGSLTLTDCTVTTPQNFVIGESNIFESNGTTPAKTVVIKHNIDKVETYGLFVAGTQVTSNNASDILGDGVFSYEPNKATLYVNGDYKKNGALFFSNTTLIDNKDVKKLTIDITSDSVFYVNYGSYAINIAKPTKITGSGKLTLNHRFNGSNPPADSAGIYAQAELTFENAIVEITDENAAIWATNVLNINASYLKATNKKGNYSSIYTRGQNSDIIISGCEFMEPTDVDIETNLYKGKTIFDTNGAVVQDILISPSCTVAFNGSGGTGTMESKKISTLVEYILPECTFTAPTNTGFYKWRINGKLYSAGEEVKINDNTVLYATWYVKEVRKRVTEPTIGAMPDNTMTDDTVVINGEPVKFEDYTIVQNSFYETSEPFVANKAYLLTANLSIKSDYGNKIYYSENTKFYLNGEQISPTVSPQSALIQYTFPPLIYAAIPFDSTSTFEVKGTLQLDEEVAAYVLEAAADNSEEAMNAYFDGDWHYDWYADGELVKSSEETSFEVPYDCSGKTIYAVLVLADQTAKSETASIPVYYYKGDIDHDGYVTDKDAAYLLKYISGTYTLTENQKSAAKTTDSTKTEPDMLDVVWILNNKTPV
ncbi:MAG: hypothetical protein IJS61_06930 [Firmicutes bacterium]|nr:hypothetical protein [Bacillota bacterium]